MKKMGLSLKTVLIGATATIGMMTLLTGCGGQPLSDEELYEQAREQNAAFKASVAAVQQQLDTGEWESTAYGGTPMTCDGGYKFEMRRLTVDGFQLPADSATTAESIAEWLQANDWSDVSVQTYEGEVANVLVQARNENVARLDVDILSGPKADSVLLRADSVCYTGDIAALDLVLMPDLRVDYRYPELEAPGDTPYFGFTEDGEPRR